MSSKIDYVSLNDVVFNDYLYGNPEVHNSFLKRKLKVLFDTIAHDDVIQGCYLNDNDPPSPMRFFYDTY